MALSFALSFAVLLSAVLPVQSSYCASTCAVHVTQPRLFFVANAPNHIPGLSRKPMVDPHRSKLVYLYLAAILVSNACDVATNPGPPKFPCNICKKAVRWTTPGVCCDTCDQWFHEAYMGMNTCIYESIASNNVSWQMMPLRHAPTYLHHSLTLPYRNTLTPFRYSHLARQVSPGAIFSYSQSSEKSDVYSKSAHRYA